MRNTVQARTKGGWRYEDSETQWGWRRNADDPDGPGFLWEETSVYDTSWPVPDDKGTNFKERDKARWKACFFVPRCDRLSRGGCVGKTNIYGQTALAAAWVPLFLLDWYEPYIQRQGNSGWLWAGSFPAQPALKTHRSIPRLATPRGFADSQRTLGSVQAEMIRVWSMQCWKSGDANYKSSANKQSHVMLGSMVAASLWVINQVTQIIIDDSRMIVMK